MCQKISPDTAGDLIAVIVDNFVVSFGIDEAAPEV